MVRGKSPFGDWVYGDYFVKDANKAYILSPEGAELYRKIEVLPSTRGSFTGLFDTNGIKIYMGDIVNHKYDATDEQFNVDQISVVTWDGLKFMLKGQKTNFKCVLCNIPLADIDFSKIYLEVIGNIYDNEDLIGGE